MIDELLELPQTPEQKAQIAFDMAVQSAFNALDEIIAVAADPMKKHMAIKEIRLIGMLKSRAELIGSFIQAANDQPGKVRMVVNNG